MCQDMGTSGYHEYSKKDIKEWTRRLAEMKQAVNDKLNDDELVKKFGLNSLGVNSTISGLEEKIKSGGYHWYEDSELRCCGQG